jgi:tRNA threonylcarbamoyladenosine biosynthesis protein TsaB
MALILNIETSTTTCSVSIGKGGEVISLHEHHGKYTHAEYLTSFIEESLKDTGIKFSDLDAIAVSKGPGSYTGLRIGVSTAKGLCFALDKPLIAIDTLKHLAHNIIAKHPKENALFCPMLDARRMEVYCAVFNQELDVIVETAAKIIEEGSFSGLLSEKVVYFFGDGAEKCQKLLASSPNAKFISDIMPSAASMAVFSEKAFNNQHFEDTAYFEPFYLKDFIASVPRNKIIS